MITVRNLSWMDDVLQVLGRNLNLSLYAPNIVVVVSTISNINTVSTVNTIVTKGTVVAGVK